MIRYRWLNQCLCEIFPHITFWIYSLANLFICAFQMKLHFCKRRQFYQKRWWKDGYFFSAKKLQIREKEHILPLAIHVRSNWIACDLWHRGKELETLPVCCFSSPSHSYDSFFVANNQFVPHCVPCVENGSNTGDLCPYSYPRGLNAA